MQPTAPTPNNTAVALLSAALPLPLLQAASDVQILPAGEFAGRDGRPGQGLTWKLTDAKGRALADRLNVRHKGTRFSLDYEHQALAAEDNGQPAPASGWATQFEWRDGQGLWATDMQWTARAKQMIEAGEYAYLSPVIIYDKRSGEVTDVFNGALTNNPNLIGMQPVAQERIARLNALFSSSTPEPSVTMNPVLKALLKALGLPDDASEQQATAALTALQAARSDLTAVLKSLGVAETTDAATAGTAVAALRAKAAAADASGGEPDPTKWVSLDKFNQLSGEVAALRANGVHREVDELVEQARIDGKCAGVVADVWRDVGRKDIAQLRALIDKTPGNPALAGLQQTQTTRISSDAGGDTLTGDEIAACKATGISREDFLKARKALSENA